MVVVMVIVVVAVGRGERRRFLREIRTCSRFFLHFRARALFKIRYTFDRGGTHTFPNYFRIIIDTCARAFPATFVTHDNSSTMTERETISLPLKLKKRIRIWRVLMRFLGVTNERNALLNSVQSPR